MSYVHAVYPACLMQENIFDPFVIYEGKIKYSSLRGDMSAAFYGRQVESLSETTKVISLSYQF